MSRILTLTLNPSIDKTIWINKLMPEKKLRCNHTEDEPGGGGINVSRAVKLLGGESKAIFLNGGYTGNYFLELIKNENITYTESRIAANTRTNLMLIDESTLLEYRIGMEGPVVTTAEVEDILHTIKQQSNYDFFVASGSLPLEISDDIYAEIAAIVESHNAKFILDTSGVALQKAIEQKIFLLKPNLNELSLLCGISEGATIADIIQATKRLLNKINCSVIVVSLGASGAILVTETETHHILSPKVEVKSTVGAGDSMVAGMTIALSKKLSWKQVLQYGIAFGSAATLNSGRGLCNPIDVEKLYQEIRNNNS